MSEDLVALAGGVLRVGGPLEKAEIATLQGCIAELRGVVAAEAKRASPAVVDLPAFRYPRDLNERAVSLGAAFRSRLLLGTCGQMLRYLHSAGTNGEASSAVANFAISSIHS
jgi:hypothetical protein